MNERMLLHRTFGNTDAMQAVVHSVARAVYNGSYYAPPSVEDTENGVLGASMAESVKNHFEAKKGTRERLAAIGMEAGYDFTDNSELGVARVMASPARNAYVDWALGDPDVYSAVLRMVLPKMRFNDTMNAQPIVIDEGRDADGNLLEDTSGMVHNNNENLNWQDRQSDLARMSIATMLPIYKVGKERIPRQRENRGVLTMQRIHQVANMAFQGIKMQDAGSFSMGEGPFRIVADNLLAIMKKDPQSPEGIVASTLYHRYFGDGYLIGDKRMVSYLSMSLDAGYMLRQLKDGSKAHTALKLRIDRANEVMNNAMGQFLSLARVNRVVTNHYQGEKYRSDDVDGFVSPNPGFSYNFIQHDNVVRMQDEINQGVRSGFVVDTNGNVTVAEEYRKRWRVGLPTDPPKEAEAFTISKEGLFDYAGNKILHPLGRTWVLDSHDPAVLFRFFEAAGYRLSSRTIEYLIEVSKNPVIGGNESDYILGDIVGGWAYSIAAGIHRVESGKYDPKNVFNTIIKDSIPHSLENVETIAGDSRLRAGNVEKGDYPMPSIFFTLNHKLAEIENRTNGTNLEPKVHLPDGKVGYLTNYAMTQSTIFPAKRPGRYSSKGVEESKDFFLRLDPALTAMVSDDEKIAGRVRDFRTEWLNPLLDPESRFRIDDVFYTTGINSDVALGATPNQMTNKDRIYNALSMFANGLLSNRADQVFDVMSLANGDRNTGIVYRLVNALQERLIEKEWDTDKYGNRTVSLKLNFNAIIPLAEKAMRYRANVASRSYQRWSALAGKDLKTVEEVAEFAKTLDKKAVLGNENMTEYADYKIGKDGSVQPGHAISYSEGTLYKRELMENGMRKEDFRHAYFTRIVGFLDQVQETAFVHGVRSNGITLTEKNVRTIVSAFWLMHHFTTLFTDNLVLGSPDRYKDKQTYDKRTVLGMSPGQNKIIGPSGVHTTMRIAIMDNVLDEDGEDLMDGQVIYTPWGHREAVRGYGGEGGVFKEASNKEVFTQPGTQNKSQSISVNEETYFLNPMYRNWTRRSLVIDGDRRLLERWDQLIPYDTRLSKRAWDSKVVLLQKEAAELGLFDKLVDMISTRGNFKSGVSGVNFHQEIEEAPAPDIPMREGESPIDAVGRKDWSVNAAKVEGLKSMEYDNRFVFYQTRLERSLDESSRKVSYPSQVGEALALSDSPLGTSDEIYKTQSEITQEFMADLYRQIDKMRGETRADRTRAWLRQLGQRKVLATGALGQVVDILLDADGNIDNPLVTHKLYEYLANQVSSGIVPKMYGQQLTAASPAGFTTADEVISKSELSEEDEKVMNTPLPTGEELGIPKTEQELSNEFDELNKNDLNNFGKEIDRRMQAGEITEKNKSMDPKKTRRSLRAPGIETFTDPLSGKTERRYVPGECLMPCMYAEAFGITNIAMPIKEVRKDIESRLGKQGLDLFNKGMKVYLSRTPGFTLGSGHFYNVVGFLNSLGNTVVAPVWYNHNTGGQYEGGQLSAWMRKIILDKESGKPKMADGKLDRLQDQLMDLYWEFYNDPHNFDLLFIKVGTDRIQSVLDELQAENPELYGLVQEPLFTAMASFETKEHAANGTGLIPIGMAMRRSYLAMYDAHKRALRQGMPSPFKGWEPALRDTAGHLVLDNISQMLHGMFANLEGMFMSLLGINGNNVGIVMGALFAGEPLKKAVQLAKDPAVMKMTRQIVRNKSLSVNTDTKQGGYSLFAQAVAHGIPGITGMRSGESPVRGATMRELVPAEDIFRFIAIGEIAMSIGPVLSLSTKGFPHTIEGAERFRATSEWMLGIPWDDLLAGESADAGSLSGLSAGRNHQEIRRRSVLAEFYDPVALVRALPGKVQQLEVARFLDELTTGSLLYKTKAVNGAKRDVIEDYALGGALRRKDDEAFLGSVYAVVIAMHLDREFSGKQIQLTEGFPPMDIGTIGGQYRFVQEFPAWFKRMQGRIDGLATGDPRKVAMENNKFLRELRTAGNAVPRIELRDGLSLKADNEYSEEVRHDVRKLEEVFSGVDVFGDMPMPMSRMFEVYSLIKDGFSSSMGSMTRLLPGNEAKRIGDNMALMTKTFDGGEEWTLADGTRLNVEGIRKLIRMAMLSRARSSLATWLPDYSNGYIRFDTPFGDAIRKNGEEGGRWVMTPWSALTPQVDIHATCEEQNIYAIRLLDNITYSELFKAGEIKYRLPVGVLQGEVGQGALFRIPTGEKLHVAQVGSNGWLVLKRNTDPT